MREQMEARLNALRREFEKGQNHLRLLELQSTSTRETLLRISGAILILQEILASPKPGALGDQPLEVNVGMESTASAA
jgi:hypothetical protein